MPGEVVDIPHIPPTYTGAAASAAAPQRETVNPTGTTQEDAYTPNPYIDAHGAGYGIKKEITREGLKPTGIVYEDPKKPTVTISEQAVPDQEKIQFNIILALVAVGAIVGGIIIWRALK